MTVTLGQPRMPRDITGEIMTHMFDNFIPLKDEMRTHLGTRDTARHLGRQQKTLINWAHEGSGPLRPIRVGGRLMWPVNKLRELLQVEPAGTTEAAKREEDETASLEAEQEPAPRHAPQAAATSRPVHRAASVGRRRTPRAVADGDGQ